jgi:hypothetical protein
MYHLICRPCVSLKKTFQPWESMKAQAFANIFFSLSFDSSFTKHQVEEVQIDSPFVYYTRKSQALHHTLKNQSVVIHIM